MRAIFTYHSVDADGSVISVEPAVFARHVEWLVSKQIPVVSVADLLARPANDTAVALTFDDAFANFATAAWPLLRAHSLPATLFVPTGYVGGTNRWSAMPGGAMTFLPLMDWDTLGQLAEEGLALGAHTRTHPDLRALDPHELEDEVAGSVEDLTRKTGRTPEGFAYPYGYVDARVAGAVRMCCRWAVTTRLRPLEPTEDPYWLPRIDTYYMRGPARLESFGSPTFGWWIGARRLVRAARGRP